MCFILCSRLILLLLFCRVSCYRATSTEIQVDGAKVSEQLKHLATFSDDPNPDVTRILFTGLFAFWNWRRGTNLNRILDELMQITTFVQGNMS